MNRRKFLAQSATPAAASVLPVASFANESMRTRLIPGTDEALSVVGLGALDIFKRLSPEGAKLPKAVIQTMVNLGGRLIDTPPFFRPNVPVIGKLSSTANHGLNLRSNTFCRIRP